MGAKRDDDDSMQIDESISNSKALDSDAMDIDMNSSAAAAKSPSAPKPMEVGEVPTTANVASLKKEAVIAEPVKPSSASDSPKKLSPDESLKRKRQQEQSAQNKRNRKKELIL